MKPYVIFTKKGFFVILALFICIGFLLSEIYAVNNGVINAKNNDDRLTFIAKLGCKVTSNQPESKIVTIPEVFHDVYNNYNNLQKSAGYDLSLYKGCEVIIYTYNINPPPEFDGESVINLMVYKDKIIGGDISSTALGGYMLPLKQVIT